MSILGDILLDGASGGVVTVIVKVQMPDNGATLPPPLTPMTMVSSV